MSNQLITFFSPYQQEAVFQNLDMGLAFQDQQLLLLNLQDIRKEENNANKSREELDALVKNPWQPYSGHLKQRLEIPEYIEVLLRSEEHTSELQSRPHLVCRLLLEKKKKNK